MLTLSIACALGPLVGTLVHAIVVARRPIYAVRALALGLRAFPNAEPGEIADAIVTVSIAQQEVATEARLAQLRRSLAERLSKRRGEPLPPGAHPIDPANDPPTLPPTQ